MSKKVDYICPECGSDMIVRDGFAAWDVDSQKWELQCFFDACSCNSCGEEFKSVKNLEIEIKEIHDALSAS